MRLPSVVAPVVLAVLLALGVGRAAAGARANYFSIDQVGLGPHGFVALHNFTDTAGSLRGLYLCQGTSCFALPSVSVAAGKTVRIATDRGAGLRNVVARRASIGQLRPHDGELALFNSKTLRTPRAMLTYMQWGSTPHRLTPIAVSAGLWLKGSYAPSAANAVLLYRNVGGLWLFKTR